MTNHCWRPSRKVGEGMLVLSRKIGESIIIHDNIVVKIVSVEGDTVKLGIEAPRNISVFRSEIVEAIKKENEGSIMKANDIDVGELNQLLNLNNKDNSNSCGS